MRTNRSMPDHEISAALAARVDATDLHGAVCGLVSGSPDLAHGLAMRDLARLLRIDLDPFAEEVSEYVQSCRESLAADDFSFAPVIAGDDASIELRVDSLARWCQGFVAGFELSTPDLDEAAEEAFEDVVAIAEIDTEAAVDDDLEADLEQVAEHVKIAVLVIHDAVQGEPFDGGD